MRWPEAEVSPLNIPAWRGFPLRRWLEEMFAGLPVRACTTTAICMAIGEHWLGAVLGAPAWVGVHRRRRRSRPGRAPVQRADRERRTRGAPRRRAGPRCFAVRLRRAWLSRNRGAGAGAGRVGPGAGLGRARRGGPGGGGPGRATRWPGRRSSARAAPSAEWSPVSPPCSTSTASSWEEGSPRRATCCSTRCRQPSAAIYGSISASGPRWSGPPSGPKPA